MDLGFIFVKKNAGGPRVAVAEGLAGARARGRSGEWKLAGGGGKGKGSPGGSYHG
jgi:hypothetical protein